MVSFFFLHSFLISSGIPADFSFHNVSDAKWGKTKYTFDAEAKSKKINDETIKKIF